MNAGEAIPFRLLHAKDRTPVQARLVNPRTGRQVASNDTKRWYDRPYYLGPDRDPGAYAALAAALDQRRVAGIARWVMRQAALRGRARVERGRPMLITLRRASWWTRPRCPGRAGAG